MRTVYCISGLGADQQIFGKLRLPGIDLQPVEWLSPARNENIHDYAGRMRRSISGKRPVLLGVSFGGMMAIEMAKEIPDATVVLVSSISDNRQLPLWMKLVGLLHIDRLTPARMIKRGRIPVVTALEDHMLGVETEEEAAMCADFRHEVDPGYLHWAIGVIVRWRNAWRPSSFYHLHGGKDRIFPLRRVDATHVVADGGHLMIHNRADKISRILQDILAG